MSASPSHGIFRALAALELRHAAALRRDRQAGRITSPAVTSAIRDCLRHARACTTSANLIRPRGLQ